MYQKERHEFGRATMHFAPSEVQLLEEFMKDDETFKFHIERNPTILDIQAKAEMSENYVSSTAFPAATLTSLIAACSPIGIATPTLSLSDPAAMAVPLPRSHPPLRPRPRPRRLAPSPSPPLFTLLLPASVAPRHPTHHSISSHYFACTQTPNLSSITPLCRATCHFVLSPLR